MANVSLVRNGIVESAAPVDGSHFILGCILSATNPDPNASHSHLNVGAC